ncbi:ImpA family type VI secretion system protein [Morganella morganii]|uniref:type VI secretion system protein TssA n=1 Tax=Morganella morganii TaxID=582 RepID=UPI0034E4F43E
MPLSQDEQKALWLPVCETQLQGEYLKADSARYRPLRNLFNIAQSSLRRLLQQTDEESRAQHRQQMLADQTALADALFPVLADTARDISLSGWYLWCQILQDPSLRALEQSLAWFSVQMTEHWEHLPPQHTEDPQAEQIKVQELSLILGTGTENCLFYSAVLLLPVADDIPYYHYLQCQHRGTLPDLPARSEEVRTDARQRIDVLTQCLTHLQPLAAFFTARSAAGTVHPAFFTELLTGYRSAVMAVSGLPLSAPPATDAPPESLPQKPESPGAAQSARPDFPALSQRNHHNRDTALRQLREISRYFRDSEPHSPISYLLEKAIRWGQMSLAGLWQEILLEDNSTLLDRIFSLTGLNDMQMTELPEPESAISGTASADENPTLPAERGNTALRW